MASGPGRRARNVWKHFERTRLMDRASRIEKLREMSDSVRIGGKGTTRRKKKVVHKIQGNDGRKLQTSMKKLGLSSIPSIEEVNMFKDDGSVTHFNNPKVQASLQANTFAVSGQAETKRITEVLPNVLNQLGPENFQNLRKLAGSLAGNEKVDDKSEMSDDEEVPNLIGNFDEQSKNE